jgi:Rab-GTPase-TBC domain
MEYIRRLMTAYTKRNPIIGYCQGMNFIVARFFQYLPNEEEAFWVFTQLVEAILPIDYYTQLIGVQVDVCVFQDLIKIKLPKVHEHMRKLMFDPIFFSLNWFICLFTDKLPEKVSFFNK